MSSGITPVVVLGASHHGGLGIVRSLGRLGIPVFVVDSRWEPAFRSRYCSGRFVLDIDDGERAAAAMWNIGHKLRGRPILMPTTDRAAIWLAEHAAPLREVFSFPHHDATLVRALCDKNLMKDLASQYGVPTARSVFPRSKHDVAQFVETADFPVMVKATDAERLRYRTGGTKFLVHSARELLELYAKAEDPGGPNLLIQEFIPGEDWMFDGYFDRHSNCKFGVTGKKIRRFPVKTGVTSLGVCLRNDTVLKITTEFMKSLGYHGILDIGYRYDYRDGQYKVLDVNPRIGCTFRLFAGEGGMDVARALYLDLTGQAVPASRAIEGRKWLVEDFDLVSSIAAFRSGDLKPGEWIRSLRGVQEAACFAMDDPLPFLLMWWSNCRDLYRWKRRRSGARFRESPETLEVAAPAGRTGRL